MSLTSTRLTVPFIVLALAALTVASCNEPLPTSPSTGASPRASSSASAASAAPQQAPTEYWVTLVDPRSQTSSGLNETAPPAPPAPGSPPVPWPPGPPPIAPPGVPVPTPPSTHFRVSIKVDPEPVPHSGTSPGLYVCRNLPYTWFYDQHLHADTGIPVILTERENFFDGYFVSKNSTTIELGGNGSAILHTRWCSAYPKPHFTQTRFTGRDGNGEPITISGPWVRLLTP